MKEIRIPQFRSYVDRSDYEALEGVFTNNYLAEGPFSRKFHDALLDLTGARFGCFASNGTVAIYLALRAAGIGAGDEVLVQNTTFIASANAVEMVGARPVFVDILSFNAPTIDLSRIQVNSRTKALVLCHLFGTACSNTEEVVSFCENHGLLLIEDAAQALGIRNQSRHCGTFGKVGTFSFYADKTITTGEGGFVVTDDETVFDKMVYLRNQGRKSSGTFIHPEIGYNFRMTDLQCALGLSQLAKWETILAKKSAIYDCYRKFLQGKVEFLSVREDFSHIPFRVVVFVPNAQKSMEFMKNEGIEPRSVFYPLHAQPCYSSYQLSDREFPSSLECYRRGICLPTWVGLTESQIEFVSQQLILSIESAGG